MSKCMLQAIWGIFDHLLLKSNYICPTYFFQDEKMAKINLLFKHVVLNLINWKSFFF